MHCPKCLENIPPHHVEVAGSREIIAFQISFSCRGCGNDFCCLVTPGGFLEVPPDTAPDAASTVFYLALTGMEVKANVAVGWDDKQRTAACDWAREVHYLAAHDKVPPMPEFLRKYQTNPFLEVT
jgi:hypothetical protein